MRQFIQLVFSILFLLFFTFSSFAQKVTERQKVTKEISMEIPKELRSMSSGERMSKYVSSKLPIAMYTSEDQLVDLGINETSTTWGTDMDILQQFYKANILNLFTEVKFLQDDVKEIAGRKFIVFEFVSTITDENATIGGTTSISKYNYIQYTLREGKVLLFNFSCPARKRAEWQPTANQMMSSVRIKS